LKGLRKGVKKSPEAEAKRQETLRQNGGIKHTEESRRRIAEANMIPIEVDGVWYRSMDHACRALGIKRTTMGARVKNPNYPNYRLAVEEG